MDGWFTVLTVLLRGDSVGGEGGEGEVVGGGARCMGLVRGGRLFWGRGRGRGDSAYLSSLTGSTLTLSISL